MAISYDFSIIRYLRKRANMTLEELARHSGLTYSTVALIEENKSTPSLKTLSAIARVFEISTGNLVSLAERRVVQIGRIQPVIMQGLKKSVIETGDIGTVNFHDCRIFHFRARSQEVVQAMELHGQCLELGIILKGKVRVTIEENNYDLTENEVILFDGVLEHFYTTLEDSQVITVHIPKDIHTIESLLEQQ